MIDLWNCPFIRQDYLSQIFFFAHVPLKETLKSMYPSQIFTVDHLIFGSYIQVVKRSCIEELAYFIVGVSQNLAALVFFFTYIY